MKKLYFFLWITVSILAIIFLAEMEKPKVKIEEGFFTPQQIFGPYVAASKGMPTYGYPYKVLLVNVSGFSALGYKKKNPDDVVLASNNGGSIIILTHDLNSLMHEIFECVGDSWLEIEFRYKTGKVKKISGRRFFML
jgi:hypothetical protein